MTTFLRIPWLEAQVAQFCGDVDIHVGKAVQFLHDSSWEVQISDKFCYMQAVLSPSCVEDFTKQNPHLPIPMLKGGLLRISEFQVLVDDRGPRLVIHKMKHIGAEASFTFGEPKNIKDSEIVQRALFNMNRTDKETQADWPLAPITDVTPPTKKQQRKLDSMWTPPRPASASLLFDGSEVVELPDGLSQHMTNENLFTQDNLLRVSGMSVSVDSPSIQGTNPAEMVLFEETVDGNIVDEEAVVAAAIEVETRLVESEQQKPEFEQQKPEEVTVVAQSTVIEEQITTVPPAFVLDVEKPADEVVIPDVKDYVSESSEEPDDMVAFAEQETKFMEEEEQHLEAMKQQLGTPLRSHQSPVREPSVARPDVDLLSSAPLVALSQPNFGSDDDEMNLSELDDIEDDANTEIQFETQAPAVRAVSSLEQKMIDNADTARNDASDRADAASQELLDAIANQSAVKTPSRPPSVESVESPTPDFPTPAQRVPASVIKPTLPQTPHTPIQFTSPSQSITPLSASAPGTSTTPGNNNKTTRIPSFTLSSDTPSPARSCDFMFERVGIRYCIHLQELYILAEDAVDFLKKLAPRNSTAHLKGYYPVQFGEDVWYLVNDVVKMSSQLGSSKFIETVSPVYLQDYVKIIGERSFISHSICRAKHEERVEIAAKRRKQSAPSALLENIPTTLVGSPVRAKQPTPGASAVASVTPVSLLAQGQKPATEEERSDRTPVQSFARRPGVGRALSNATTPVLIPEARSTERTTPKRLILDEPETKPVVSAGKSKRKVEMDGEEEIVIPRTHASTSAKKSSSLQEVRERFAISLGPVAAGPKKHKVDFLSFLD